MNNEKTGKTPHPILSTSHRERIKVRGFPCNQPEATSRRSGRTKVGMISLGCAKNLVDAEIMLGNVLQHGMEITSDADDADVLVINTCAFIDSAKEESIDAILEAHQQRGLSKRPNQKLIVSGCMSQRFARELRESLPEKTSNVLRPTPNIQYRMFDVRCSAFGVRRFFGNQSRAFQFRHRATDLHT